MFPCPHRSQRGQPSTLREGEGWQHPRAFLTVWQWGVGRGAVCSPRPAPDPQACRDFLELAETHSRKWQRALQYEQDQRVHLEETIEQLARQHNSLERAFRSAPGRAAHPTKSFSEGELVRAARPGWLPRSGRLASVLPPVLRLRRLLPAGSAYTAAQPPVHIPLNMPTFRPMWLCISHPPPKASYLPAFRFQFSQEKSSEPNCPSVTELPWCQVADHLAFGWGDRSVRRGS